LSWGDKGNPNPNNPTIDLFTAADSDRGLGYLTNSQTAVAQTSALYPYVGRLGPGTNIVVVSNGVALASSHLIWCGVKKGSGALTLTFSKGTNVLASTSTYIEIKDIKQLYERWTIGESPNTAPANQPTLAQNGLATGTPAFQYALPTDTNTTYTLLVHDYDLDTWKKDRYAETAFKRLYWQGYDGRFGLFRWPSGNSIVPPFNKSEFNAWRSGGGLLNLLSKLNTQYPGNVLLMAHGYGTIVAGEALRQAGTNWLVDRYVAMQGAIASQAYDPFAPIRIIPPGADDGTPNRYLFYYTNGAAPYFWGSGGAATYINYFNTNDVVLINAWRSSQDEKPVTGYFWIGTNFFKAGATLLFPTNTYEIFSYCDEARCEAIGAQPGLMFPFDVSEQVDLSTLPASIGSDHSGQFESFCADEWPFWDKLLRSMRLK
jgi:hypothetical protein